MDSGSGIKIEDLAVLCTLAKRKTSDPKMHAYVYLHDSYDEMQTTR